MPNLREFVGEEGGDQVDAVAPAETTPWVSTSLLHSQFHVDALRRDETGYTLDTDVPSLVERLSAAGYETAAFIADNPNLQHYADQFDTYWDGRDRAGPGRESSVDAWLSRFRRTALLQKSVPATEIADRAREWYESTDSPRFLWMHLMEPHSPYYPGLGHGVDIGLLRSYRANVELFREGQRKADLSSRAIAALPELYRRCVRRLDEQFPRLVEFLDDDALVAITGDHGEAFDHGWIGHVGLYDETVRVPLYLVNVPRAADAAGTVRQYDLAPTILDALGERPPDGWEGVPIQRSREEDGLTPLATVNSAVGEEGHVYLGVRDDQHKLLRTHDISAGTVVREELFDLRADPTESTNVRESVSVPALESALDSFVARHDPVDRLTALTGSEAPMSREASSDVRHRLADLGYV